jgi:hypothetical protein
VGWERKICAFWWRWSWGLLYGGEELVAAKRGLERLQGLYFPKNGGLFFLLSHLKDGATDGLVGVEDTRAQTREEAGDRRRRSPVQDPGGRGGDRLVALVLATVHNRAVDGRRGEERGSRARGEERSRQGRELAAGVDVRLAVEFSRVDEGVGVVGPHRRSICLYEAFDGAQRAPFVTLAGWLTVHDGGGGEGGVVACVDAGRALEEVEV